MADRIASDAEVEQLRRHARAHQAIHLSGSFGALLPAVLARLAAAEKVVEAARERLRAEDAWEGSAADDERERQAVASMRDALDAYDAARKESGNAL